MLRLLVALDFSECSRLALGAALEVVRHVGQAELVLLTVLDAVGSDEARSDNALGEAERACGALHRMLEDLVAERPGTKLGPGVAVRYTTARGVPADEIVAQALAHRVAAIVMGSHGRTGLDRLLAGSVAERVVRNAPCSVLTVKPNKTS